MVHWTTTFAEVTETTLSPLLSEVQQNGPKQTSIYRLPTSPTKFPSCRSHTVEHTDSGSVIWFSFPPRLMQDWLRKRNNNVSEGVLGWQNSFKEENTPTVLLLQVEWDLFTVEHEKTDGELIRPELFTVPDNVLQFKPNGFNSAVLLSCWTAQYRSHNNNTFCSWGQPFFLYVWDSGNRYTF